MAQNQSSVKQIDRQSHLEIDIVGACQRRIGFQSQCNLDTKGRYYGHRYRITAAKLSYKSSCYGSSKDECRRDDCWLLWSSIVHPGAAATTRMAFKGKNAIVTGGAGGIGLQVVKQLLMAGAAKVAIIDLQDNLEEFVKLRAAHPSQSLMTIKMDVANKKGVEATYEEISKTFGSIDIVVNVAGIFNDKDVQRTLLVNLGGIINSSLSALRFMTKDNGGKGGIVVNMSSVVGLDPMFIIPIYGATKAGIINFTRCLGRENFYLRSGIKFITVCPGATMTDMFTNFTEKIIFPETSDETYKILDRLNKQSAADVSRCILNVLEKEENGAVYVIEGKRIYPIEMKRHWTGQEKELA